MNSIEMITDKSAQDVLISDDLRDKILLVFLSDGLIDSESRLMEILSPKKDFPKDSSHGKFSIKVQTKG